MSSPYPEPIWKDILACGDAVEASLARSGVLLTMGGEPTFVPTSPTGAEWQTAALGPTKLAYARQLARKLARRLSRRRRPRNFRQTLPRRAARTLGSPRPTPRRRHAALA
jgi:uncharacterized protein (DUF2126 family)